MYFDVTKMSSAENSLVAFFHAQRTGGSAFKRFLRNNVGDDKVYAEQTVNDFKHWKKLSEMDLEGYRVFAGHSDYRFRRFSSRTLLLVTLLRDPVYRAASLHQYCQNKEGHALQALARSTDMLEFHRRGSQVNPNYFINVQCRRVCGKASAEKAIQLIESEYFAVGETDALSTFSDKWAQTMGWDVQPIAPQPKDSERYEPLINDSFKMEVLSGNQEDAELYRYMKDHYFN